MDEIVGQRLAGAIHKGRQSPGQLFQPEENGIVEHGAGGGIAISAKSSLRSRPEEQFIAMNPATQVHDRLARQVTKHARKLGKYTLLIGFPESLRCHCHHPIGIIG